ncbi:ATP-binding protein [Caulobacter sp. NIBR1757]|uniref:cell cycle histidine kinase CckA n=1 Tax=Caulobacter sp. NIBR1757 TaxID=3016000 RepID=UPI0022F0B7F8|nr:ATP-binding protein [Caulobacter sp. NIBR1757]WGM39698.1 Sensor histidine kinase RcsC [Caulobacter sp. NIBR1757]
MSEKRKVRFDPLVGAAAVFFVLAVGFAAYPALEAGVDTLAGLLLLIGLAGVACLGLLAFRASGTPNEADDTPMLEAMVEALPEAAAVAGLDGKIIAANDPWTTELGAGGRLPRNGQAAGLYGAFNRARRGLAANTSLKLKDGDRELAVASLGPGRFLLRLAAERSLVLPPAEISPRALAIPTAAEAGLDALAAASPFGAALLDGADVFTARIVEANTALGEITGGAAKPGLVFGELVAESSRLDAGLGAAEGRAGPFEVRLNHDNTRIGHLYLNRQGGRLTAYLVDVSEQKQIELQLAQAQKMQAIGQLAGGVAHDFNNLLTAIQLRLDELLQRHPLGDPSYEGLNEIRQTGVRAADLVRKLLAFSRKQTVQREVLELGELISEFEVLLRRLLREDVKLVTDYGRNLPLVRADKSQLETAVMNLAVNARDAVRAAGSGGTVRIRTARVSHIEAANLGYAGLPMGDMALIEVSDDGPGIPPEVVGKIFDPFFTTKPVGEGTGLGLATVYGIVKQSDGWIHVESEPGQGAVFRIFLPVHVPVAGAAPVVEAVKPVRQAARDLSGVGRILFVEDEDAVRGVAARLLRARGYEVIEACDGEEALELCIEHAGTIDLLISDVIMPGMDGPTLLKKARGYLGDAPVMFISGYAEAEFSDLLEGEEGVSFLPKPIDIKTLAERVKQQIAA